MFVIVVVASAVLLLLSVMQLRALGAYVVDFVTYIIAVVFLSLLLLLVVVVVMKMKLLLLLMLMLLLTLLLVFHASSTSTHSVPNPVTRRLFNNHSVASNENPKKYQIKKT